MENGLVNKDNRQLVVSRSWHWNLICTRPWSYNQLTVCFSLHLKTLTFARPSITESIWLCKISIFTFNTNKNSLSISSLWYAWYIIYYTLESRHMSFEFFSRFRLHSISTDFTLKSKGFNSKMQVSSVFGTRVCKTVCM